MKLVSSLLLVAAPVLVSGIDRYYQVSKTSANARNFNLDRICQYDFGPEYSAVRFNDEAFQNVKDTLDDAQDLFTGVGLNAGNDIVADEKYVLFDPKGRKLFVTWLGTDGSRAAGLVQPTDAAEKILCGPEFILAPGYEISKTLADWDDADLDATCKHDFGGSSHAMRYDDPTFSSIKGGFFNGAKTLFQDVGRNKKYFMLDQNGDGIFIWWHGMQLAEGTNQLDASAGSQQVLCYTPPPTSAPTGSNPFTGSGVTIDGVELLDDQGNPFPSASPSVSPSESPSKAATSPPTTSAPATNSPTTSAAQDQSGKVPQGLNNNAGVTGKGPKGLKKKGGDEAPGSKMKAGGGSSGSTGVRAPKMPKKRAGGGASGDPHFAAWNGAKFDFHGGCDLVLLAIPNFMAGLGLHVHIRTKIDSWWSFIETAVVRIGEHTLEVSGGEDGGSYFLNGEPGKDLEEGDELEFSRFKIEFHRDTTKQKKYRIGLRNGDALAIETYKDFVRVAVHANSPDGKSLDKFNGSSGLMGSFPHGRMLARDGVTEMDDTDAYGKEWQVLDSEPKLFLSTDGTVQHPTECVMPSREASASRKKRRLGEAAITEEAAALACAHALDDERDACIFDVLATNDKDMAGAY